MNPAIKIAAAGTATLFVACLMISKLAGGSGRSGTVSVNAGHFIAASKDQSGPGDVPATVRLAEEIKKNPDAGKYIVTWQNAYPSGTTLDETLEYDANESTLWFHAQPAEGCTMSA